MHVPVNDLHLPRAGDCSQRKNQSRFCFFDEVFHCAATTVELDNFVRFHFRGDNERVHMDARFIRLFDLKDNPSRMGPATCLIHNNRHTDSI